MGFNSAFKGLNSSRILNVVIKEFAQMVRTLLNTVKPSPLKENRSLIGQ
jgi:hypothetical protein